MVETEGFSFTRDVDAPRALVFQVWTDPECLKHWWGPKGFAWSTRTNSPLILRRPENLFRTIPSTAAQLAS